MKLIRPGGPPATARRRGAADVPGWTTVKTRAQQAAAEKTMARYTPLECGHYLTRGMAEIYKCFAPRAGIFYCEYCDADRSPQESPRRLRDIPDQPPF